MLFLAVCAMAAMAMAVETTVASKSPLLGDYSTFKRDKEDKTMLVYRLKDRKASDYKKFIIDPVLIYPSDHRGGPKYSPENLQETADYFRSLLTEALKSGYEVTSAAGPGVLRLRFGIRDLKPGRYTMDAAGMQTIKPDTKLAEVTFEMEGIDSLTGERIIAIVRDVKSEEVKGADREKQIQRVSDLFSAWVKLLRNRLDQSNIPQ
jgi:hypothetical protein